MVTTLLSERFIQVMFGVGKPLAVHLSDNTSPLFTVVLSEMKVICGGTVKTQKQDYDYAKLFSKIKKDINSVTL